VLSERTVNELTHGGNLIAILVMTIGENQKGANLKGELMSGRRRDPRKKRWGGSPTRRMPNPHKKKRQNQNPRKKRKRMLPPPPPLLLVVVVEMMGGAWSPANDVLAVVEWAVASKQRLPPHPHPHSLSPNSFFVASGDKKLCWCEKVEWCSSNLSPSPFLQKLSYATTILITLPLPFPFDD